MAIRLLQCVIPKHVLSKLSGEMLADIEKETVDFVWNFDDTEKEPTVLPAKYPNLLVNGSTGISAGYATEIPTHNSGEVIDGTSLFDRSSQCQA
jgi:topoisomerase-4 subunit A